MSDAYEKALEAAHAMARYTDTEKRKAVDAFLAALPPSIVVDGRVVDLRQAEIAACEVCDDDGIEMVDSMVMYGIPGGFVPDLCSAPIHGLLDAAREVAE